jgi:hypothetical protein
MRLLWKLRRWFYLHRLNRLHHAGLLTARDVRQRLIARGYI